MTDAPSRDSAHADVPVLIEEMFSGRQLRKRQVERMRDHVRACRSCRQLYDRHVEAEVTLVKVVEGSDSEAYDDALTEMQLLRVQGRLLVQPRRQSRWTGFVPALATAAVLASLTALTVMRFEHVQGSTQFQERGSDEMAHPGTKLRVLQLRRQPASSDLVLTELKPGFTLGNSSQVILVGSCAVEHCWVTVTAEADDRKPNVLVAKTMLDRDRAQTRLAGPWMIPESWPAGAYRLKAEFQGPAGFKVVRVIHFEVSR